MSEQQHTMEAKGYNGNGKQKKGQDIKATTNKKKEQRKSSRKCHRHRQHLTQLPNEDEGYLADDERESDKVMKKVCEEEFEDKGYLADDECEV